MRMPELTALLTATAVFTSALAFAAKADEVHVLNWKGYGADEPWAVEAFEKATGNKVVNDFFNSEQEMLTKIRTNPGLYDVVMINAAFNDQAMAEKLIQPIDTSKLPNYADISPDKAGSPMLDHDGKVYGVPWVWGLTALAINEKSFDKPPTSIAEMWDPAHKGRVVIRDDAVEAVQFGAIATGQNINDIKDMDAVKAKLTSLMPQIKTFWSSENDWNQMVASNQIDIGTYWSGSADRAKTHFKLPVSLVIPQEGAVAWLDAFSIPVGSKNVAGAAGLHQLHDRSEILCRMGHQGRRPGLGQHQGGRSAARGCLQPQGHGRSGGRQAHPVPGADHRRPARGLSGAVAAAEGRREIRSTSGPAGDRRPVVPIPGRRVSWQCRVRSRREAD